MSTRTFLLAVTLLAIVSALTAMAASPWTDPNDSSLPPDFKIQGEYVGEIKGGGKLACQVIALDKGVFQAVILPGGLPGAGWDGQNKIIMDGKLEGDGATFKPAEGSKSYLANEPEKFSATSQFPPSGQKPYSGKISGDTLTGKTDDGKSFELKRTIRTSPTLGAEPPKEAIILFDGTKASAEKWKGGRFDEKTKLLNTDGADIATQQKFNNYTMHVEFLLPFKPEGRGQGRGNSGFYQVDQYEMQILDSFGLDGKNNECGGIYSKQDPLVNACLPPLQWQTYDVEFTNAVGDNTGKNANARITAKLNGILIHDNYEIPGVTGGARQEPEGTPGAIKLQGHGNPLQFRNVWIVEKK
jgi:hypothetical protein